MFQVGNERKMNDDHDTRLGLCNYLNMSLVVPRPASSWHSSS
jgi:hypothetical protein